MSEVKKIPESWLETTLLDVTSFLGDGLHGTPNYSDDGEYYFINGNNLNDGKIEIKPETKRCSIDEYNKYKKNLNDRTILVSINGSLGYFAYYYNEKCILGKSACYFNIKENIDKKFIGYQIRSTYFQKYIERLAGGTTIKNVSLKTMREFPFLIPKDINEQKSIAQILTAFDDKIQLLQAQNKTLEATAQTIFTEWFGKYSIDDELPEGWRVGKLSDLVEKISKGTTATKDDLSGLDGEIAFLKVKDISNDGLILKNNLELIPKIVHENQLKRSILETNDILFSIAGTIGRLAIVDTEMNNANCNQALAFVRLKDKYAYLEYIHLWLKSKETQDVIISNIVQGVQANVSLTVLGNLSLLIPNKETINNWCYLIKPIYQKLKNNQEQIQSLVKTRDELLPRLMSGEVRVNEFKK